MRTIRRKPTTAELKYLLERQLYHVGEDVVVDGRLLYELMKEVLEWREAAPTDGRASG